VSHPVLIPNVLCKVETAKAILCVIEGEEVWVPKSQVHEDSEVFERNHEGTLAVKEWFARKEGWV